MKMEISPQARKYIGEKGGFITARIYYRVTGG